MIPWSMDLQKLPPIYLPIIIYVYVETILSHIIHTFTNLKPYQSVSSRFQEEIGVITCSQPLLWSSGNIYVSLRPEINCPAIIYMFVEKNVIY